jgi:Fe-S cluster biosynthesis and repair protein YggX
MPHLLTCTKLGKEAERFDQPPIPGPLGIRIQNEISKEAFGLWKNQQTMLINEYRLNLADPEARRFLMAEMEKFFFGSGAKPPAGFIPPETSS